MGLFKRAAARGVAHELVRRGVVSFPSKEAADEAADAVADAMPDAGPQGGMPEVSGDQGHSPEEIAEIANKLIEIAHALMAEAGGGGAGGPPPEIAKAASELQKFAAEYTLESIASAVAVECMDKAAAEKEAGSLINGGDKQNTPEAAKKVTEIGALDQKQRPTGYAVVGQGNANFSEPQASRVGTEEKHPNGPHNTPAGTNSVVQASKTGGDLTDDEKMFVGLFSKCAEDVGPYLPAKLSEDEKVAAIRHMMGMNHDERQTYIDGLHGKQAGEMPPGLKAMHGDESKHESGESKKEEKKEHESGEEKKEKKEGALLEQIKKIAAAKSQQPRS